MAKTLTEQLLQDILRRLALLEDISTKVDSIELQNEELIEKLSNISTPGVDYNTTEYP